MPPSPPGGAADENATTEAPPPTVARPFAWGSEDSGVQRERPEIEVIRNKPLTVREVVAALKANGGMDVAAVKPDPECNMCETMIFVTGGAAAHRRRLAQVVVTALKKRRLTAVGREGFEGERDDDWLLVDCDNIILHVMTAEARRSLGLERHWSRTVAKDGLREMTSVNDQNFETVMDQWVSANPVPDGYDPHVGGSLDDDDDKAIRKMIQRAERPPRAFF